MWLILVGLEFRTNVVTCDGSNGQTIYFWYTFQAKQPNASCAALGAGTQPLHAAIMINDDI